MSLYSKNLYLVGNYMATAKSTKRQLSGDSPPLPNLPEEIITEILLRLPVKSLLKFRCVSKSWLSLICSPQFMNDRLMISIKYNSGFHNRILFGSDRHFYTFDLYPKKNENCCVSTSVFDYPLDGAIRIVGSCNGLVCVALEDCAVVLWNPATRKSKKLPVFNGNVFPIEYGFGYDALNDDYKVFVFSWIFRGDEEEEQYDETEMEVYSSRANSWRIVDWANGKINDGGGVFLNGYIHWKVNSVDNLSNCAVIAQNVTTESCANMALPKAMNVSDHGKVMVGVSGGFLCVSYDYISYMDVWVMKGYGVEESWTKLVCLPYFFCGRHSDHVRPKVLFVSENGGVILSLGSDLIMYKPSQYHEFFRLGDGVEVEAATYSESFVSPDFDNVGWS